MMTLSEEAATQPSAIGLEIKECNRIPILAD